VQKQELFQYAAEHLYAATVQATEEAIINALVAAKTMTGLNGSRVHALPHDVLSEVLRRHGRLND
jgi:D-aminopeptidase